MINNFKKWFKKLVETTITAEVFILVKYNSKIITNRKYVKLFYIPGEIEDALKERIIEAADREEYMTAFQNELKDKTNFNIKIIRGEEVIQYKQSEVEEEKIIFDQYDILILEITSLLFNKQSFADINSPYD